METLRQTNKRIAANYGEIVEVARENTADLLRRAAAQRGSQSMTDEQWAERMVRDTEGAAD